MLVHSPLVALTNDSSQLRNALAPVVEPLKPV